MSNKITAFLEKKVRLPDCFCKDDSIRKAKLAGFGEHANPCSVKRYRLIQAVHILAIATLIAGAAALTAFGVVAGLAVAGVIVVPTVVAGGAALPPAAVIGGVVAAAAALLVAGAVASVATALRLRYLKSAAFGTLNDIAKGLAPTTPLGEYGECEAIVCDDSVEAFEWKKTLIRSAEHNIVMSGNYCGGESFNEILDLMDEQLEAKPGLKIVLLSSDRFIQEDNWEKIREITDAYPGRFQLVESPDIVHANPGIKKTTNHTKLLAIDYGRYFLQGGSGIDDRYTRERGDAPSPLQGRKKGDSGLVENFLPDGFRDGDFVFRSPEEDGVGRLVYQEGLKLALRWKGLEKETTFGLKSNKKEHSINRGGLAEELLLAEGKTFVRFQPETEVREFLGSGKQVGECQTKILVTGPEHKHNSFERELIERFDNAEERIIIDHLYFHPSTKVRNALIRAANRGVSITVITNGYDKEISPGGHMFFGPRNKYNMAKIIDKTQKEFQGNLEYYEYKVPNKTLHKKLIIVDDYVIAGSSNFGYKSLGPMSDHEMNFITKNALFANEAARVALEQDASIDEDGNFGLSMKVEDLKSSTPLAFRAAGHRILAPVIG